MLGSTIIWKLSVVVVVCLPLSHSAEVCLNCKNGVDWSEGCEVGWYGTNCRFPCFGGCKDNTCDIDTGHCGNCTTGLTGDFCDKICPNNCDDTGCSQDGSCHGCIDNTYHGVLCTEPCNEECIGCFQKNATCIICQTGLYGVTCEKHCSDKCVFHECDMQGHCKMGCNDGRFYGRECDLECNSNVTHCLVCISPQGTPDCLKCSDATYGKNCEKDCPANCDVCISSQECTKCSDGYSGILCNCTIPNCDRCDINGFCEKCEPGYFGEQCQNTCPDCQTCEAGIPKSTPFCLSCNDGFFKNDTACLPCPKSCTHCTSMTECTGCKPGLHDITCKKACSTNCDGACDQSTGKCKVCRSKFYGNYCTEKCPDKCGPAPNKTRIVCKPLNADCLYCLPGLYGEQCQNVCESNCALLDNVANCKKANGHCIGCQKGHYGEFCRLKCDHCKDLRCHQNSGHCVDGCIKGWSNMTCTERCSSKCREEDCDWLSGVCLTGCIEGYGGQFCNKVLPEEEGLGVFPIIIVVTVPVILFLVAVIIFLIIWSDAICRRDSAARSENYNLSSHGLDSR